MSGTMRKHKKRTLTPFLDEVDRRRKLFFPDLENMPAPSEMDQYFLEVAEKHDLDLLECEPWEEEP